MSMETRKAEKDDIVGLEDRMVLKLHGEVQSLRSERKQWGGKAEESIRAIEAGRHMQDAKK